MLNGIRRGFFCSQAQQAFMDNHALSDTTNVSFWEKSTISSLVYEKHSIFFEHKKSLKMHVTKIKVALCVFCFGVFSSVKAFFIMCPLLITAGKFLNKIINKCSE